MPQQRRTNRAPQRRVQKLQTCRAPKRLRTVSDDDGIETPPKRFHIGSDRLQGTVLWFCENIDWKSIVDKKTLQEKVEDEFNGEDNAIGSGTVKDEHGNLFDFRSYDYFFVPGDKVFRHILSLIHRRVDTVVE